MTVRQKILGLFAIVAAVAIAGAALLLTSFGALERNAQRLSELSDLQRATERTYTLLFKQQNGFNRVLVSASSSDFDALSRANDLIEAEFDSLATMVDAFGDEDLAQRLASLRQEHANWMTNYVDASIGAMVRPAGVDLARAREASGLSDFSRLLIEQKIGDLGAYLSEAVEAREQLGSALIGRVVSVLAAAGGALLIALVLAAGLTSHILVHLRRRLDQMADGNADSSDKDLERRDEFGALARAGAAFSRRAEAAEAARREAEAADARAEGDRRALMTEIADSVGGIVAAARAGNFSQRASEDVSDPALAGMVGDVNRLMETLATNLDAVRRMLSSLATADLRERIKLDAEGDFKALFSDANKTADELTALIGDVRQAGGAALKAAHEIRGAASDLQARAETQASTVEETAATMEEMATGVRSNAEALTDAERLSDEMATRAAGGIETVREATAAVTRIEQSSVKIADITSVIDSIAFQTNLLALNAAVEAARAGDAGKGFAVVAAEVRNLAQRASQSAKEISQLIETSGGHVADGVRLVDQTRASLEEIAGAAGNLQRRVGELSSAGREQANGIAELNAAVSQIDKVTQENTALADRSAATAGTLDADMDRLIVLVERFRLSDRPAQSPGRAQQDRAPAAPKTAGARPAAKPAKTLVAKPGGSKPAAATPNVSAERAAQAPRPATAGATALKPSEDALDAAFLAADESMEDFSEF